MPIASLEATAHGQCGHHALCEARAAVCLVPEGGVSEVEDDTLSPTATPTSGSLGGPSSMQPSHVLPPKPDNVKRACELRQGLEAERVRREARIQELYDELFVLWERFGVTEPEMEEFVLANSGTTNASIQAVSPSRYLAAAVCHFSHTENILPLLCSTSPS